MPLIVHSTCPAPAASRERANGAAVADGLAHVGDGGIDEVLRSPGGLGAADYESEVAQDIGAGLSVAYFRVELYREHFFGGIFDGGDCVGRTGGQVETGGQLHGFVAVRHPDGKVLRQTAKQV